MSKVIVHTNADGSICVTHPNYSTMRADETEDEFLARVEARAREVGSIQGRADTVDRTAIPTDRKYREAWRFDRGAKCFSLCPVTKAAIDARPRLKTLEERIAALEEAAK